MYKPYIARSGDREARLLIRYKDGVARAVVMSGVFVVEAWLIIIVLNTMGNNRNPMWYAAAVMMGAAVITLALAAVLAYRARAWRRYLEEGRVVEVERSTYKAYKKIRQLARNGQLPGRDDLFALQVKIDAIRKDAQCRVESTLSGWEGLWRSKGG